MLSSIRKDTLQLTLINQSVNYLWQSYFVWIAHTVECVIHIYVIFQIQRKRNYLSHLHKVHLGDHHHHHLEFHGDHHVHHQNYGDNVYYYQKDHLNLYLYFNHFSLMTEKDNTAGLSRTPRLNQHHLIHGGFDQQHYSWLTTGIDCLYRGLFEESHKGLVLPNVFQGCSYFRKIHHQNVQFVDIHDLVD